MTDQKLQPTSLSFTERLGVGVWRHGLVPLFSFIGGGSAPATRVRELRHDAHADAVMDFYAPSVATPARAPVVFVHGGGRISGSKGRFYHRPLLGLADVGHPVYSVNYPLAPESPHPGPLRLLLSALAMLPLGDKLRADVVQFFSGVQTPRPRTGARS